MKPGTTISAAAVHVPARRERPAARGRRSSTIRPSSMTRLPGSMTRSGSTIDAPESTARGDPAPRRLTSSGIADVPLELAPLERQRAARPRRGTARDPRARSSRRSHRSSGAAEHDHAGALAGREPPIVEVVAIERDQRAAQLPREPVVLDVAARGAGRRARARTARPSRARAHEGDDAGRHVGVGVDARRRRTRSTMRRRARTTAFPSSLARTLGREHLAQLPVPIISAGSLRHRLLVARCAAFAWRSRSATSCVALVHELLARPAAVRRSDGVLAEQRKRDRRVAVGDDGVGQHARIHLAPAHRLGRRRARTARPRRPGRS